MRSRALGLGGWKEARAELSAASSDPPDSDAYRNAQREMLPPPLIL